MEPLLRAAEALAAASATTLAVAVLSYFWWRSFQSARSRNDVRCTNGRMPSPRPVLPACFGMIGGHTLAIHEGRGVEQLEDWAQEFGGDYELQLRGVRVICVTGLSDIRRILTLRPSRFTRGIRYDPFKWAATQVGLKKSMFFEEGKNWGRSRRLISPNLNGHNITAMLPIIAKVSERLCVKLGERADAKEVVAGRDCFGRFTHDVIALTAFGADVGSINATKEKPCPSYEAIESQTSTLTQLVRKPFVIAAWRFLPMLSWVRNTKEHGRRLERVVQGAIDRVRQEASAPTSRPEGEISFEGTLLRKIVGATNNKDSSNSSSDRMLFSDREVMDEARSLFVAGTETTGLTLCWAMYYLIKTPEAFARCRAEALKAAPSSNGIVSTSEQLSQLVFCAAVFKEALRLRTPAPLLALNSAEDFTMESGFVMERGTGLFVLTRAVGVSDEFFTRGKEFVPQRWIEAEREEALLGTGGAGSVMHEEEAFLSLGHGPRVCPGQAMAKTEGAIIIAAICARFDLSLAPGQADPPEEVVSFTSGPKELNIVIRRREKA